VDEVEVIFSFSTFPQHSLVANSYDIFFVNHTSTPEKGSKTYVQRAQTSSARVYQPDTQCTNEREIHVKIHMTVLLYACTMHSFSLPDTDGTEN